MSLDEVRHGVFGAVAVDHLFGGVVGRQGQRPGRVPEVPAFRQLLHGLAQLVLPRVVRQRVSVVGAHPRRARPLHGTPALPLQPRRLVHVDLAAHGPRSAHWKIGLRILETNEQRYQQVLCWGTVGSPRTGSETELEWASFLLRRFYRGSASGVSGPFRRGRVAEKSKVIPRGQLVSRNAVDLIIADRVGTPFSEASVARLCARSNLPAHTRLFLFTPPARLFT